MSDPEGTFDAMTKLTQATDFLLLAAGTGETNRYMYMCMHVHVYAHVLVHVHAYMGCIHAILHEKILQTSTIVN